MRLLIAAGSFLAAMMFVPLLVQDGVAQEDAPTYVGSDACKKCHFKQHRSWKKTVHAKALQSLKPGVKVEEKMAAGLDGEKDYTTDPSCLECHVTGYAKPGGYPAYRADWSDDEIKLAKNNAGVGCESCHGPGSLYSPYKKENEQYKRAEIEKLGLNWRLQAENCTRCHNQKSPTYKEFDFEARVKDMDAIHEHLPLKHDHADDRR